MLNELIKNTFARDAVDGVLGVYLYQCVMEKFSTGREASSCLKDVKSYVLNTDPSWVFGG